MTSLSPAILAALKRMYAESTLVVVDVEGEQPVLTGSWELLDAIQGYLPALMEELEANRKVISEAGLRITAQQREIEALVHALTEVHFHESRY